jgi:hypothetical protein
MGRHVLLPGHLLGRSTFHGVCQRRISLETDLSSVEFDETSIISGERSVRQNAAYTSTPSMGREEIASFCGKKKDSFESDLDSIVVRVRLFESSKTVSAPEKIHLLGGLCER